MPKVWLITGSSRGLGRALSEAVLAAGDKLVHRLICSWHMVGFKMGRRQGARRAHI
jgi:NAD(P)-dependent dehydrogenase (short-subunit alcohol dehydrogenase family)